MSDSDKPDADKDEQAFTALPKPEAGDESTPPPAEKSARRGRFSMPEGAFGIFVLLLLVAACGGLIAVYWPWMTGSDAGNSTMADRVAALESRVGQIAAGKAPAVAAAGFDDLQRKVADLKAKLDADEARLSAVETSPGASGNADIAPLKASIDKNSSDIAQLSQQIGKLASAPAKPDASPELASKLAADDKAIAALKSDLDAQAKARGEALDALGQRIAALEKTAPPADLAAQLNALAPKSDVTTLGARVSRLESKDAAGLMRRAASVLALADLVRASEGETPFANELTALKSVMPPAPEITELSQYAKTGVPTVSTLTKRFEARIDPILAAERAAQAKNWAERLWYDVVGLISVRRVGNVSGTDTQARVARAEYALRHGDLAAAVHEVEALDKPAKGAVTAWLRDAKARLAVTQDSRALTNRIVSELAAAEAERKAGEAPQSGGQP